MTHRALDAQVDEVEADLEMMTAKKSRSNKSEINHLEESLTKHHWYPLCTNCL